MEHFVVHLYCANYEHKTCLIIIINIIITIIILIVIIKSNKTSKTFFPTYVGANPLYIKQF